MNSHNMLVITMGILALCVWGMPPLSADAADFYQWKDTAGHWHFTDNPGQVPPRYRKAVKIRSVQPVDTAKSTVNRAPSTVLSGGKKLWEEKCASCHFIHGDGLGKDGKRGLQRFIINRKTLYPFQPEEILPKLQYAVSGRTSDMPPISISNKKLTLLIHYLISTFK